MERTAKDELKQHIVGREQWFQLTDNTTPPPCLRKPTSSTPSPTPPSSSSRRPSASWTQTRMALCPPLTWFLHLLPTVRILEVEGPMNFTQMVTLFASKMAGGSDDDDVIL